MEKDAVEAEKAIKDKVESVTKPETIPIPGPHNSKTIPLPKTACFQKIGPNDPLVFQVGCVKH